MRVLLECGRVGGVIEQREASLIQPLVRVAFNAKEDSTLNRKMWAYPSRWAKAGPTRTSAANPTPK